MPKKAQPKFTPKSGNPAKRAQEAAAFKAAEEKKRQDARYAREYAKTREDSIPQNVGSMYQPPIDLEPLPNVVMPPPIKKKKAKKSKEDKRKRMQKVGTGIIVGSAALALLGSTFAPLLEANSMKQINEQNQTLQQDAVLLDKNGNRVLVDREGNPLDGTPRSDYETPVEESAPAADFGNDQTIDVTPENITPEKEAKEGATK